MNQLHIIDTLGAFIEPSDQSVINWSKIDFRNLEQHGRLSTKTQKRICNRFEIYIQQVKELGYDSLSFDDLAHLVTFDWYPDYLQSLLDDYAQLYTEMFNIANNHSMKIFVNSDYMFTNKFIREYIARENLSTADIFSVALDQVMKHYPLINGIILRIGENDGKDVTGDFLSSLALRTPAAANKLLKRIIPFFEQHNKTLIFRTWTVGVYKIGDFIWNESTYNAVFDGIESDSLVVSMKFGDTDFMRYLNLNPLIQSTKQKKIIELQTRREWEGMGMYPSFVGWDYEQYYKQLKKNSSVIGIHVWCQTGGWAKKEWSNITYLDGSSFWSELNTFVTARVYIHHDTVEQAVAHFCNSYDIADVSKFTELLRLSDIAVKKGIYISELASHSYYFRRSRVPTLFWITWDAPLIQPIAVSVIRSLVKHPQRAIHEVRDAIEVSRRMYALAEEMKLPEDILRSLRLLTDTLDMFADLKSYIFGVLPRSDIEAFEAKRQRYVATYPDGYSIPKLRSKVRTSRYSRALSRYPIKRILRTHPSYRRRDKVMLASSPVQRRLIQAYMKLTRSKLADQSMGIDSLFK